LKIIINSKERS